MAKNNYEEPEYLQLSKEEKISIMKKLRMFPISCFVFLIIMLIGELFPQTIIPSFTKCTYLFKANYIARDLVTGNIDSIISHNLMYYDINEINYTLSNGIQDIYNKTRDSVELAYDANFKNKSVLSLMIGLNYKKGGSLSDFAISEAHHGVWSCIGYASIGGHDIVQITIDFISPEIYCVHLKPVSGVSEDAPEKEKEWMKKFKDSYEYKTMESASLQIEWMLRILSNQNDMSKNISRLFGNKNQSVSGIEKCFSTLFTNHAFSDDEKDEDLYKSNLAWMLYVINRDYQIDNAYVSIGEYNKTLSGTKNIFTFIISDEFNNKANLSLTAIYTPYGYQIIPNLISYVHDSNFFCPRVQELIDFITYDKMPEDVLLEKASVEILMETKIPVKKEQ